MSSAAAGRDSIPLAVNAGSFPGAGARSITSDFEARRTTFPATTSGEGFDPERPDLPTTIDDGAKFKVVSLVPGAFEGSTGPLAACTEGVVVVHSRVRGLTSTQVPQRLRGANRQHPIARVFLLPLSFSARGKSVAKPSESLGVAAAAQPERVRSQFPAQFSSAED